MKKTYKILSIFLFFLIILSILVKNEVVTILSDTVSFDSFYPYTIKNNQIFKDRYPSNINKPWECQGEIIGTFSQNYKQNITNTIIFETLPIDKKNNQFIWIAGYPNNVLFVIQYFDNNLNVFTDTIKKPIGEKFIKLFLKPYFNKFKICITDTLQKPNKWVAISTPHTQKLFLTQIKLFLTQTTPIILLSIYCFILFLIFLSPGFIICYILIKKNYLPNISTALQLLISFLLSAIIAYFLMYVFLFAKFIIGIIILIIIFIFTIFFYFKKIRQYIKSNVNNLWVITTYLTVVFLIGLFYITYTYIHHLYYIDALSFASDYVRGNDAIQFNPLPPDNIIPKLLFERFYNGIVSNEPLLGDWLASDRPPLFASHYFLILFFKFGILDVVYQFCGVFFISFWIIALIALAQCLNFTKKTLLASICLILFSHFTLVNSTFIWPKLITIIPFILAYILFYNFIIKDVQHYYVIDILFGISIISPFLYHGGSMFTLIAFFIIAVKHVLKLNIKRIAIISLSVIIVYLPWYIYQNYYDPPGNRLLKWHLAGHIPVDNTSFLQSLKHSYDISIKQIVNLKIQNFKDLFPNFNQFFSNNPFNTLFYNLFSTLYLAIPAVIVFIICIINKQKKQNLIKQYFFPIALLTILSIISNCLLKFNNVCIHESSYIHVFTFFILIAIIIDSNNNNTVFSFFTLTSLIYYIYYEIIIINIFTPLEINYSMLLIHLILLTLFAYYLFIKPNKLLL